MTIIINDVSAFLAFFFGGALGMYMCMKFNEFINLNRKDSNVKNEAHGTAKIGDRAKGV